MTKPLPLWSRNREDNSNPQLEVERTPHAAAGIALTFCHEMLTKKRITIITAIGLLSFMIGLLSFIFLNPDFYLYRSSESVEAYLKSETPLGTPEAAVMAYLKENEMNPDAIRRVHVTISTSYPPSSVEGESFIRALVGEYDIVFTTSVESFYTFDSDGMLADIKIRKTTDAL